VDSIAKELKVNDQIRARQVRLIGADGQQQGILDTRDALQRARDADLDLVLVGEQAQPPVARLLDYGKYRYELQQQAKEARKRSRQHEMKAIKFRVKIEDHDYETKVNHIRRFLKGGHKVKVTIMFRGRERTHPELGQGLLNRVAQDLDEVAVVDQSPSLSGMDMNMTLRPHVVAAPPTEGEATVEVTPQAEAASTVEAPPQAEAGS
jgi:translation initiation factor IF-3